MLEIPEISKENLSIGMEVNENFFIGETSSEALSKLHEVGTGAIFMQYVLGKDVKIKEALTKLESILNILKFIEEKKEGCRARDAIEIATYSRTYAIHASDRKRRSTT